MWQKEVRMISILFPMLPYLALHHLKCFSEGRVKEAEDDKSGRYSIIMVCIWRWGWEAEQKCLKFLPILMESVWSPHICAVDVLSKQHCPSLLVTFTMVKDALVGELSNREEVTTSIYWKPTKCQAHWLCLVLLNKLDLSTFDPQSLGHSSALINVWWMSEWMSKWMDTKLKTWKLRVGHEFAIQWRYRDLCCMSFGKL